MSSHNSGRSPKDLRHILSTTKEDDSCFSEDIQLNLTKLKTLPQEELSENAMLRGRIDQQSELICILKKQADTALTKSLELERDMKELQKAKEEAECNYHDEIRKFHVLEKRFDVLLYNHEEIIKFKDEYKASNDELRQRNNELMNWKAGYEATLLQEKDVSVKSIKSELTNIQQKYNKSEEQLRNLQERSAFNEKQSSEVREKLKLQVSAAECRAKELEGKKTSLSLQLLSREKEIEKLRDEEKIFTQLVSEQKQADSDNQQTISGLLKKVKELELSLKKQGEKFRKEFEEASANAQVRKLSAALKKAEEKIKNHDKEFAAYKTHTDKLLSREKELNTKLRELIG